MANISEYFQPFADRFVSPKKPAWATPDVVSGLRAKATQHSMLDVPPELEPGDPRDALKQMFGADYVFGGR